MAELSQVDDKSSVKKKWKHRLPLLVQPCKRTFTDLDWAIHNSWAVMQAFSCGVTWTTCSVVSFRKLFLDKQFRLMFVESEILPPFC